MEDRRLSGSAGAEPGGTWPPSKVSRARAPSLATARACRPFRCWLPEPREPSGGHSIRAFGPGCRQQVEVLLHTTLMPPASEGPAGQVTGAPLCSGQFIWSSHSRSGPPGSQLDQAHRSGCVSALPSPRPDVGLVNLSQPAGLVEQDFRDPGPQVPSWLWGQHRQDACACVGTRVSWLVTCGSGGHVALGNVQVSLGTCSPV